MTDEEMRKYLWKKQFEAKYGEGEEARKAEMNRRRNLRVNKYVPEGFKDVELAKRANKISQETRKK